MSKVVYFLLCFYVRLGFFILLLEVIMYVVEEEFICFLVDSKIYGEKYNFVE